jgi:diguanylate cyclase (GGDEF)-like protein
MKESLFVYDQFGKCIWANENGLKLTGVKKNEYEEVSPVLRKMFGERPFTHDDWSYKRIIGSGEDASYYTLENYFVSEDSKHLAGSYLIVRDDTEEQKKIKRDLYNSTHDSLTGLYTKQYLFTSIAEVLEADPEKKYSVVFVDVKNFKIVNDTYGHDVGDDVLAELGALLLQYKNDNTITARWGGEEFLVICFGDSPKDRLIDICEEIRKTVEAKTMYFDGFSLKFTISVGAASKDANEVFEDTFKKADQNLYEAKGTGKNKVVYK